MKVFLPLVIMILILSCSSEKSHSDVHGFFTSLAVSDSASLDSCLSERTLKFASAGSGNEYNSIIAFVKDFKRAEWKIGKTRIDENKACVEIVYKSHPVENRRGFCSEFYLVKEDGEWKLDFFHEMKKSPGNMDSGVSEYIKSKKKIY